MQRVELGLNTKRLRLMLVIVKIVQYHGGENDYIELCQLAAEDGASRMLVQVAENHMH